MKVVAILGGLGSQMFKYAFFWQLKDEDKCYIDTTPFRLQKMWNGYELGRIFGIIEDDITKFLTEDDLRNWREEGINYKKVSERIMPGVDKNKLVISIFRGYCYPQEKYKILSFMALAYNKLKRYLCREKIKDEYPFFYKTNLFSIYYDEFNHTSDKYLGNGKKKVELRNIFCFPPFTDDRNLRAMDFMEKTESVAVHVRRSDHMYDNIKLFENGYFEKTVHYIKEHTDKPVFFLFSDEPDWCRQNKKLLGLEVGDKVEIVDWNVGDESFRDMQLMTYCQHNILSISSFGWWGYYLSSRKEKMVCAPEGYWLEVAIHF